VIALVKIQGVDPITVQRLRERSRSSILELDQTKSTKNRDVFDKEQRKGRQQRQRKTLDQSIAKLNALLEEVGAPISFKKVLKQDQVFVQVIDAKGAILNEVFPERIFQFVKDLDSPKGFVVDDSR
jgi:uncharacterized FlaG/YvyC family protein